METLFSDDRGDQIAIETIFAYGIVRDILEFYLGLTKKILSRKKTHPTQLDTIEETVD